MIARLVANQCYDLEMLCREYKGKHKTVLNYEHHPDNPCCKYCLVLEQHARPKNGASCTEEQQWSVFYNAGSVFYSLRETLTE